MIKLTEREAHLINRVFKIDDFGYTCQITLQKPGLPSRIRAMVIQEWDETVETWHLSGLLPSRFCKTDFIFHFIHKGTRYYYTLHTVDMTVSRRNAPKEKSL